MYLKEELIRAWVEAENRLDGSGEIDRPEVFQKKCLWAKLFDGE